MNAPDKLARLDRPDAAELGRFAELAWDERLLPELRDYIAVPAKSPMFDADWVAHGHIEQTHKLAHVASLELRLALAKIRKDARGLDIPALPLEP